MSGIDEQLGERRYSPYRRRLLRHAVVRTLRTRRTLPAVLASGALAVLGGLVTAEVLSTLAGHPIGLVPYENLAAYARKTRWRDPAVLAMAGGVTVIGLVLIALAVIPGHTRLVPLDVSKEGLALGLTRSGLRRSLAAAVHEIDGVARVQIRLHRRSVTVVAIIERHARPRVAESIRATITRRICHLGVLPRRAVAVRVRKKAR